MANADLKKMTVTIAGRDYPVRVKESEIEIVKRAEKEINRKLRDLQLQYNKNDLQDCLSMILLTYAVDTQQKSEGETGTEKLNTHFDRINEVLDSLLRS